MCGGVVTDGVSKGAGGVKGLFEGPEVPKPPPRVPEAPRAPSTTSDINTGDRDRQRRASASGQGGRSTILTGSRGIQDGSATTQKTLLGQ